MPSAVTRTIPGKTTRPIIGFTEKNRVSYIALDHAMYPIINYYRIQHACMHIQHNFTNISVYSCSCDQKIK